ncbi:MAG: VWA domain-containing protein, partial [Gemmataceae bacterium]|nr:VWA domain-containing protein [Gemmataceae bacterium]
MPAPKVLSGLPKPVLFGLYGAAGGLLGALLFGELVLLLLKPKKAEAAPLPPPEPRLAVGTADQLQIYQSGTNKLLVQIARADFDEDVRVRVEGLPEGVTAPAAEVVIPKGATAGAIELRATPTAPTTEKRGVKVTATARAGDKDLRAETAVAVAPLLPPRPQADIVFVLDVTGSMQNQIDGLQRGIGTFARDLESAKVDGRFGCVAFRDLVVNDRDPATGSPVPSMKVIRFNGNTFTADPGAFAREVGVEKAIGGGDDPESSLDAVAEACKSSNYDFRKGAARVLVLITDAAPKVLSVGVKDATDALKAATIDQLHLVINAPGRAQYRELQRGVAGVPSDGGGTDRGREFGLNETAANEKAFTDVLVPQMSKAVVAAAEAKPAARPELAKQEVVAPELKVVKAVQAEDAVAAADAGQLVVAVAVWTGAIAALVCLFLVGGQHHYLRGSLPSGGGIAAGLVGGLVVGLIGGAAGQGLFLLAPDSSVLTIIFRVMGWTLLGALAGVGLSLFVPNLKTVYGLAGGAVGGAAGAVGFIVVTDAANAFLGRLAGGLLLGLCIGLMIAFVEAAFRSAWLE